MEPIPQTMRALVARKYCKPDGYEVMELPVPGIKAPDEILVRVHAAAMSYGEIQQAAGTFKMVITSS